MRREISTLTLNDYGYLHKILKFESTETKSTYLCNCVQYLSSQITDETWSIHDKEDYFYMLQCIDANLINIPMTESNKKQLKINTLLILDCIKDSFVNQDMDIEDIEYLKHL